jgi:hypothetical protein
LDEHRAVQVLAGGNLNFLRLLYDEDPLFTVTMKPRRGVTEFQDVDKGRMHQTDHRPCHRWLGDEALMPFLMRFEQL